MPLMMGVEMVLRSSSAKATKKMTVNGVAGRNIVATLCLRNIQTSVVSL